MRNVLLTILSVIAIFCISYFLPPLIGSISSDPVLWVIFFSGLYLGLSIVILKINYFIVHYIKAFLLIIVCGVCHYISVAATLRLQSYVFQYMMSNEYQSQSDNGLASINVEDYNIYAYSIGNLIAISVLILCLSFIVKFKKWFRLSIFGTSIIMTFIMYVIIAKLSHYYFEGQKEILIPGLAFAIWQCVVGTVIYKGIKDDLSINPLSQADASAGLA